MLGPKSSSVIPKEIKFREFRVGENVFCSALIEIKKKMASTVEPIFNENLLCVKNASRDAAPTTSGRRLNSTNYRKGLNGLRLRST